MQFYRLYCPLNRPGETEADRIRHGLKRCTFRETDLFTLDYSSDPPRLEPVCEHDKSQKVPIFESQKWFKGPMEHYWSENKNRCFLNARIVEAQRDALNAEKEARIQELLTTLPGRAYKCMIVLEESSGTDNTQTVAQKVHTYITEYGDSLYGTVLSCEVELTSAKVQKDNYDPHHTILFVTGRITTIQKTDKSEPEKVGNEIWFATGWHNIEANGNFLFAEAGINDGGCLNCGGGYEVLCMPLDLFKKYECLASVDSNDAKMLLNIQQYLGNKGVSVDLEELVTAAKS